MTNGFEEQPRLQVEDISLSWDNMPVCKHISFDVLPGQIIGLIGRSGSGKTTIFHAVAGLTNPDSGRVLLDGDDITGKAGKISYMLQKDLLLEQHTIVDNVAMPLTIGGMARAEARAVAAEHFPKFGLSGCEKQYPFQLSGGMRQRAALLRTYLMGNSVVLMDEPFSALDPFTRTEMRKWFLETLTPTGISFVLITHDVDEAIAMTDRILVLSGNPAQGKTSTIIGTVDIRSPREMREQFMLTDEGLAVKKEVLAMLDDSKLESNGAKPKPHNKPKPNNDKLKPNNGKPKPKPSAPKYRDINEDDDGYHPYSDRPEMRPLFERDPWA